MLIFSFDPDASGMLQSTLVRTRGVVAITPTNIAADIEYQGAFGVAIVTDIAVAAGIGSIPDPISDADWDGWAVWRSFAARMEFISGVGTQLMSQSLEIDSKGMRKVGDEESLVVVAASQSGDAFKVYDGTRHLFMLA